MQDISSNQAAAISQYLLSKGGKVADRIVSLARQEGSVWYVESEGGQTAYVLMTKRMSDQPVAWVYEDGEYVLGQWTPEMV